MAKAKASAVKTGTVLKYNEKLVKVEAFTHSTPGNLRAFYQASMRDITTGNKVEHRFRTDEEVTIVRVETKKCQFLYEDKNRNSLIVMDNDTYEQSEIPSHLLGKRTCFLCNDVHIEVSKDTDTGNVIAAELPPHIESKVTESDLAVKGDTATGASKLVTIETGAKIKVPLFIKLGDKIKIDVQSGNYIERVK